MSLQQIFILMASALAAIAMAIAAISLVHAFMDAAVPDIMMRNLQMWVSTTALPAALILAAAVVVQYLFRKK